MTAKEIKALFAAAGLTVIESRIVEIEVSSPDGEVNIVCQGNSLKDALETAWFEYAGE